MTARHRLLERARALRERELAAEQEMARELQERVQRLAPELRRAEMREYFRAHGRELRSRLRPALRERLEAATREQRRRFFENLFERREGASHSVLGKLLREPFGLAPSELQRLERLTPAQRAGALRELGRNLDRLLAAPPTRVDSR